MPPGPPPDDSCGDAGVVDAVVVDYRAGELLERCVTSLLAAGSRRVVVVDNSRERRSSTALAGMLAGPGGPPGGGVRSAAGPGGAVRVVDSPSNDGFGAGANRGIAETTSDLVLVCNPDIEMDPRALPAMVSAIGGAEQRVAAVAPRLLDAEGRQRAGMRPLPSLRSSALWALLGPVGGAGALERRRARQAAQLAAGAPAWIPGTCMLLRREAFVQAGGFDERYFLYLEEVDLCRRLAEGGWRVAEAGDAVVRHAGAASTSQRGIRPVLRYHLSLWRYLERSTRGARRCVLPVAALAVGARCALTLALALTRAPTELLAAPAQKAPPD